MKLATLLLSLLLLSAVCVGQTTYTQTTSTCTERSCTNAQFTPTATLSYNVNLTQCGGNFAGVADWNGQQFSDFTGTYKWIGYYSYPRIGKYLLKGTFNNGSITVSETFETGFRSCQPIQNLSGTVVTQ